MSFEFIRGDGHTSNDAGRIAHHCVFFRSFARMNCKILSSREPSYIANALPFSSPSAAPCGLIRAEELPSFLAVVCFLSSLFTALYPFLQETVTTPVKTGCKLIANWSVYNLSNWCHWMVFILDCSIVEYSCSWWETYFLPTWFQAICAQSLTP